MAPGGDGAAGQLADAPQLIDRLASTMPDASLFAFDSDLRVVAAHGPHPEPATPAFIQELVRDIIATASWADVREHYEATLRGDRRAFDYTAREAQAIHRVHFAPLAGRDGSVEGVLAIAHEVAEADAARREVERRLRHESALADIATRALGLGNPDELLRFACERAADGGGHGVGLLEPGEDGRLALTASAGLPDAVHARLPLTPDELESGALEELLSDRACVVLPLDTAGRPG